MGNGQSAAESELLAEAARKVRVPEGWMVHVTSDGVPYFENTIDGHLQWEMPTRAAADLPPPTTDPAAASNDSLAAQAGSAIGKARDMSAKAVAGGGAAARRSGEHLSGHLKPTAEEREGELGVALLRDGGMTLAPADEVAPRRAFLEGGKLRLVASASAPARAPAPRAAAAADGGAAEDVSIVVDLGEVTEVSSLPPFEAGGRGFALRLVLAAPSALADPSSTGFEDAGDAEDGDAKEGDAKEGDAKEGDAKEGDAKDDGESEAPPGAAAPSITAIVLVAASEEEQLAWQRVLRRVATALRNWRAMRSSSDAVAGEINRQLGAIAGKANPFFAKGGWRKNAGDAGLKRGGLLRRG